MAYREWRWVIWQFRLCEEGIGMRLPTLLLRAV